MNKAILTILFLLLASSAIHELAAQNKYEYISKQDSITFYQKWIMNKDQTGPKELSLNFFNSDTSKRKVVFKVAFYYQGVLKEESEEIIVCIKPGKSLKGKWAGLIFQPLAMTPAELSSDNFSWEFTKLEVLKDEDCD